MLMSRDHATLRVLAEQVNCVIKEVLFPDNLQLKVALFYIRGS